MRLMLLTISLVAVLCGCGAPTKSAGDVASLFSGSGLTLQAKETDLCGQLASRTTPPTTQGLNFDLAGCQNAGLAALDYNTASSFYFTGLDSIGGSSGSASSTTTTSATVINASVRSQIWLNKSLLDLAQAVSGLMAKQGTGTAGGVISLPSSGGSGLGGLVTPTITITTPATLDTTNFSFSTKLNLTLTGAVQVNNDIAVDGRLIDNMFAVTIATTADKAYKDSLLKNFQAVIVIIPHAGDVYLDLFVNININSFGLATLVKSQVTTFLSSGLKSAIDEAMQL